MGNIAGNSREESIPQPRLKNIAKIKIFPPFRKKKHFEDKTAFDLASKECIKAILLAFPHDSETKSNNR